jgi:branched-chain amino acid transport system permease protein
MLQQLLNAIVLGSVFLLFSFGLSLAWGTLDVLNLSHGALFVLGAYAAYELNQSTSLPLIPVTLISIVGVGLVAALLEAVAFGRIRERIRNKRQAELGVLVASLGGATIIGQLIAIATKSQIFSQTLVSPAEQHVGSIQFSNVDATIVIVAAIVAVLLHFAITKSRQGRAVRALAVDPVTAGLMGVNVRWLAIATMFVSGALAGLAGTLLSYDTSGMTTASGDTYMLSAFAILVVGGVGSIGGAVIVSYGLAIAQTAIVAYGPANYQTGIAFALIFVFLILRPTGLFARQLGLRV